MNRLIAALAAAVSLTAFASASAQAPAIAIPTDEYRLPEFGGWGFNPADLDMAIKPGDDFFAYVNGKWAAKETIPPQYPYSGNALGLRLGAERDIRKVIEEMAAGSFPAGSLERRIGDAYKTFLDVAAINAAGMAPARPFLDRIAGAKAREDLARMFAAPGFPSPIGGFVSIDRQNPAANVMYVAVGGLGLPDRDYYLDDSEKNLTLRAQYKDYLAFLLGKAGYADPKAAAERVYTLEKQFAALGWDRAIARNPELTTTRVTPAQLKAVAGGFPVDTMLTGMKLAQQRDFIVQQMPPPEEVLTKLGLTPEQRAKLGGGMPAMLAVLNTAPIADIQAWAAAHFLSANAAVLPSEIDDANFAFYGKTLQGRTAQRARWQRGVSFVEGAMGEALGKVYVQRHFPEASKTAMVELVGNLRLALAANLKDLAWMTPATRIAAQKKLDAFGVKIGYPDKFETYDGLEIAPGQALANNVAAGDWAWSDQLGDLGLRTRDDCIAHRRPREPRLPEQRGSPRTGGQLPRVHDCERRLGCADQRRVTDRLARLRIEVGRDQRFREQTSDH